MNKDNLRISKNLNELEKFVRSHIHKEYDFLIWQDQDHIKMAVPATLSKINLSHDQLIIDFKFKEESLLRSRVETFMMCPQMNLLLRGNIKLITRSGIRIILKKKHYCLEKRDNQRIDLINKEFNASIFRRLDLKDKEKAEEVRLKDISDTGCGFYITSSRAVLFQPDSKLVLNSLENVKFDIPITGIIKHITPVETDIKLNSLNSKVFLVGVQFDKSYKDIDTIIQKVEVEQLS